MNIFENAFLQGYYAGIYKVAAKVGLSGVATKVTNTNPTITNKIKTFTSAKPRNNFEHPISSRKKISMKPVTATNNPTPTSKSTYTPQTSTPTGVKPLQGGYNV